MHAGGKLIHRLDCIAILLDHSMWWSVGNQILCIHGGVELSGDALLQRRRKAKIELVNVSEGILKGTRIKLIVTNNQKRY
jgi:hypothetical protein